MFSASVEPVLYVALVMLFCLPLCIIAYTRHILSLGGVVTAFAIGAVIGIFGGILWLLLLFILLISSFAVTTYKYELKVAMGVNEGIRGERRAMNVIVHGVVPCAAALLNFLQRDMNANIPFFNGHTAAILFITSISAAGADTIASELGVLSNKTYLITTFKRVKPGTNGGISLFGTACALAGAAYISFVGWYILSLDHVIFWNKPVILLIPLVSGFIGCNIDSLLGATAETKGFIGKHANNLISISCALVVSFAIIILFGT